MKSWTPAVLIAVLLIVIGCGDEDVATGPQKPDTFWNPLGLTGNVFLELLYSEKSLYTVGACEGAFVQTPAFFGSWTNLGLSDTCRVIPGGGVQALTFHQDALYAGVSHPRAYLLPGVLRWSERDSIWVPVPDALSGTSVTHLKSISEGKLMVTTFINGILVSSDGGATWEQSYGSEGSMMGGIQIYPTSTAVYVAGQSPFGTPTLIRSQDEGETWENLAGKLSGGAGTRLRSVAVSDDDPSKVYIFLGGTAYVCEGDCVAFEPILETTAAGGIVANPRDADEVWVAADSLYQSTDGGATWNSHALPPGGKRLGQMAADWTRRYLAVVVWMDPGGEMYCVNMDAGPTLIEP